ncbi:MAG: ribonuclease P protein component [Myxococcota bacterium]
MSERGAQRFPKSARLLRSREFRRTQRGRRAACSMLVIHVRPNDVARPRLGLAVGRKVGPAVIRNRIKRKIREGFRLARWPEGADLLVVVRPGGRALADAHPLAIWDRVQTLIRRTSR